MHAMPLQFVRGPWPRLACALVLGAVASASNGEEPANYFNDPFLQVTDGLRDCPVPPGPRMTQEQMRAESHARAERGTSCYQSGRCRLPNSYLYDQDIVARARKALLVDGRFAQTSLWIEGRRRWVWLHGCVLHRAQAQQAEQLVRSIDDVEAVVNELVVTGGPQRP